MYVLFLGSFFHQNYPFLYNLSILLNFRKKQNKIDNGHEPNVDWLALNFQQTLTQRQTQFSVIKTNKRRVRINILANRLHTINNLINLNDLNMPLITLKVKYKKKS